MDPIQPVPALAERITATYTCPSRHNFSRVFSADVTAPETWDCPHCGKTGTTSSHATSEETPVETRTHWDMLMERRTLDELSAMLAERVNQLRAD